MVGWRCSPAGCPRPGAANSSLWAVPWRPGRSQRTPRGVDGLHHQLVEFARMFAVRRDQRAKVSTLARIGLPEVVADDLRHERVDPFVVGHARAAGVWPSQAGPHRIRAAQAGDAELTVAAEGQGVEEIVVDCSVESRPPARAAYRPHEESALSMTVAARPAPPHLPAR